MRHLRGWRKQRPDHRDLLSMVSAVSGHADLRAKLSTVEDQGQLGSCVGNALSSACEFLLGLGAKDPELSRLFVYYFGRVLEGTTHSDSGCEIRDAIKGLAKYGIALEKLWPYNINRYAAHPSVAAMADAATRRITRYELCVGLDAIRTALAQGHPVTGGFTCYESLNSDETARTGRVPLPTAHEATIGGHCVLFCGYNDSMRLLLFQNSWGKTWGEAGFGYLPYDYVKRGLADDFWKVLA